MTHSNDSYRQETSRNVMITFCTLQLFIQAMVLAYIFAIQPSPLIYQRIIQFCLAGIILFSLIKYKEFWTTRKCVAVFLIFYTFMAYLGWRTELIFASSKFWVPYASYKLQMIFLAFLVPGTYLMNFIMMCLLSFLAIFQWFYLDIRHAPNAILTVEPYLSMIYAGTSFSLFWFRYRDQRIIELLSRQKERAENNEKIASIMMSMKDRMNTPLQSQIMAIELMKKKCPELQHLIVPLESSMNKIVAVTRMIEKIENEYPSIHPSLMTEKEMTEFLKHSGE